MGVPNTDFLFATPSFLGGAATVLSLGGFRHEYNQSATEASADAIALDSDWSAVGSDLISASQALETSDAQ
jgi:hypothetical protein